MRDLLVQREENEFGVEVEHVHEDGVEFVRAVATSGTRIAQRRIFREAPQWYRTTDTYAVAYGVRGGKILQCGLEALDTAVRRLREREA